MPGKRMRLAVTKSQRKRVYKPKRRPYKKRSNTRVKRNAKMGKGFAPKMTMTLKYSERLDITMTAGVQGKAAFRCNSLAKPNVISTGHQPMGFDQMSLIYNHYTVIGAKIKWQCVQAQNSQSVAFRYGCYIDDGSMGNVTFDNIAEQTQASQERLMGPDGAKTVWFTQKWSAKKQFGGSILGNDNLQGNCNNTIGGTTGATDPAEMSNFVLICRPGDNASTAITLVNVDIEYIVVFEELKKLASS